MYLFILILAIIFGFGIGSVCATLKIRSLVEESTTLKIRSLVEKYEEEILQLKKKIKQN